MNLRSAILSACVLALGGTAFAQGEALQRCQRIAEPAARLACYDALLPPNGPAAGAAAAAGAAPAAPANAAAGTAATPASAESAFGLRPKERTDELQAVESRIAGAFDGWGPNQRIRLQNGQVWQVIDGSSGVVADGTVRVRVRRAALGSFMMEFEGLNKSPRVRRVE